MRVLVCGWRGWNDTQFIYKHLDRLHREHMFDVVIEGDQRGVDRMAGYWGRRNKLTVLPFKVTSEEWRRIGRAAGPIRNKRMLTEGKPNLVVAFPNTLDGKGTQNMMKQADEYGIKVLEIPLPV